MRMPTRSVAGRQAGAIGLGCMGMSWGYTPAERDDATSQAVIRRALDLGVTLIDTADMYGPFVNEELVGRALRGRRDEAVLATKGGYVVRADRTIARDGRPEHLRAAFHGSLLRLGVDHVDLYYLHRVDPDVPIEESWGALAELVQAGHAHALGMSEATRDELDRAHALHPVAALQSELSLWTRDAIDGGTLTWCAEHDAAFVAFCPLGRGFLTGTVHAGSFGADDTRSSKPRFTPAAMAANRGLVDRVLAVADRLEVTPAQLALAWVLAQGAHVLPIPGTRRPSRLVENAGAAGLVLDAATLAELDALPPAVGARYAPAAPRAGG